MPRPYPAAPAPPTAPEAMPRPYPATHASPTIPRPWSRPHQNFKSSVSKVSRFTTPTALSPGMIPAHSPGLKMS